MRIVFAGTGDTRLSGGLIMAILIGNAMVELGHEVEYMNSAEAEGWADLKVRYRPGSITDPADLVGVDAVITGWDGVAPALASRVPVVAHLCAGYEPHLWPGVRERFEAAYRLPSLKLVIAPHLQVTLKRELGVDSVVVGAPVDLRTFSPEPRESRPSGARPRVLTVGPEPEGPYAPVPFKGIRDVLEVITAVREGGRDVELVRLTPREDSLIGAPDVDELHVGVPPADVPRIYRSCDVYLGASTFAEGLGMPAFEAACSGLQLVLPDIPSFLEVEELRSSAQFYPAGDRAAAAARLESLLAGPTIPRTSDDGIRERLVQRFSPTRVAERALAAIAGALRR